MKLPAIIELRDYHQVTFVKDVLKALGLKGVKCKDIAFHGGEYIAMIYQGRIDSPENKAMLEHHENIENAENQE